MAHKLMLVLAMLSMVSACVLPVQNYEPRELIVAIPKAGSVNMAYVGDQLLSYGTQTESDGILVTANAKVPFSYEIHPGYFVKFGENKAFEFFQSGGSDPGWIYYGGRKNPAVHPCVRKSDGALCVLGAGAIVAYPKAGKYERVKVSTMASSSFHQTLIYSGMIGSKINVSYREFSNDLARPAFNNDVEYDLSSSRVIGYKGARLEIIEATNEYLKYKVLSHFTETKK